MPNLKLVHVHTLLFQGTSIAKCHIFLWRHTDKLVISDIDGTITKSDVLGHILPVIGKCDI